MKFDNNFQVESYFFQRKLNYRKWNKNIFHWITKVCFIIFCIWGIDWCHLFSLVHCCYSVKLCPSHADPMNCSTSRFPVLRPIAEFAQTHVHWVSDAIQPSHPVIRFFCLQLFPASESFPPESALRFRWPKYWSFSISSVLPVNIQN